MSTAAEHHHEGPGEQLPFIDEYSVKVDAPPERVWDALVHDALRRFGGGAGPLGPIGARLLGCPHVHPPPRGSGVPSEIVGFRVERAERPRLVALAGRHRFSRYALTLRIQPAAGASRLSAETRAVFPGPAGRCYRALVIGSGGHVIAIRLLLRGVRRTAIDPPEAGRSGIGPPGEAGRSGRE